MASKDKRKSIPSIPRVYLYKLRKKVGLSAEETSRRLGISKNYYYFLECGKRGNNLNPIMLDKLCKVLCVDANQLLVLEISYINERSEYIEEKLKARKLDKLPSQCR